MSTRLAAAGSLAIGVALVANIGRHFLKPWLMSHFEPKNWADAILTTVNIRHDSPPTLAYGLFYGGIGIALVGLLGLLPRTGESTLLARATRLAVVVGQASFVSYVLQQWLIDFVPVWVGFDSWLTPATCPVYLALTTVLMFWTALAWGRRKANRFMTLGLQPGRAAAALSEHRTVLAAATVVLIIALNILAVLNAPKLTPARLALVPPNPYPWTPAKVAGHR